MRIKPDLIVKKSFWTLFKSLFNKKFWFEGTDWQHVTAELLADSNAKNFNSMLVFVVLIVASTQNSYVITMILQTRTKTENKRFEFSILKVKKWVNTASNWHW